MESYISFASRYRSRSENKCSTRMKFKLLFICCLALQNFKIAAETHSDCNLSMFEEKNMGTYSKISVRDTSSLIIFFAILLFGSNSFAYDDPVGYISIDCGGVAGNWTDPQTNLLWVNDDNYIATGKRGSIQNEELLSRMSTFDNSEALKSFRYFPEDPEEIQSKYCYELSTTTSNASFLLRVMFLHGNATELTLPSFFYLYLNGSMVAWFNYTVDHDLLDPVLFESIFFPPADGKRINLCLVPVIGVPFISSLELREFDRKGVMYTKSFGNLVHEGVFFTNMIRWNVGAPNMTTVRYPHDPYDRFWSYPPGSWSLVQNISSEQTWAQAQIGPEVNSIPSEVMRHAWAASSPINFHVPLQYSSVGSFTNGIFYFALLNESTGDDPLSLTIALDTIEYPSFNVTGEPSQISLFHTLNAEYVGIQISDSVILNALEFYLQQSLVIPTTYPGDVDVVNHIKDVLNMTKWQGDPCTPKEYDWLVCDLDYYEGNQYLVDGIMLSHLPDSRRLTQLAGSDKWVVYYISITNSDIDSELFRFLLSDWINATYIYTLDLSFNTINTFPDKEWWTDLASGSKYSLYSLDLSSNQLSQIPPFRDLPFSSNLITLNLSQNLFTGDFPNQSYFSNFISLEELNISFNNFEGEVPSSLSSQKLQNLTTLDISNNNFSGEFPSNFYFDSNGSFQSLYADNNKFEGVLDLTAWYSTLQRALSNTTSSTVVHATFDSPTNSFNQLFSFTNNKISSIKPSTEEFQSVIENLIGRDGFNQSGVLLGRNPYCRNAKHVTQKFLCRSSTSEIVYPDVKKKSKTPIILGSVFGGFFLVACFAFFTWRIRKLSKAVDSLLVEKELEKRKVQPPYFFYNDLKSATQNFHSSKHLGRGNFGAVYKGVLSDGNTIAVKKLFNTKQNQVLDEFLNEVVLITGIKHKNLIQLKGCCIENQERILVFGYAENGNIEDALWGDDSNIHLTWATRFKICVGIASGLTYLHEKLQPRIIHRDIKPANILLDKNLDPKIADFGLAKHFLENIDVHVTQVIAGTRGYFAPEYISEGRVSPKIDVFSFGVLALEIVSGRRCVDPRLPQEEVHLTSWAQKLQRSGSLLELLDPVVGINYPEAQVLKVMNIALMCVRHDPDCRPTMSEVETMLLEGKESTYEKLNSATLRSHEERDLSQDHIYRSFGNGMGSETVAMLFPNSRESSARGGGRRMKNVEESPLLRGRPGEAYEELPSFDSAEAYSRTLRSMNRSLSERIIRGSSSSGSI